MNNKFPCSRHMFPKMIVHAVEPKDSLTDYNKATLNLHQLSGKEGDHVSAGVEPQNSLEQTALKK